MSIDYEHETIITLGEACKAFPPTGVSTATMARWIQRGIKGVKLETIVIGHRRLTSREAIQRFIAAQNSSDERVAPTITAEQRHRQAMATQHELKRAGIGSPVHT